MVGCMIILPRRYLTNGANQTNNGGMSSYSRPVKMRAKFVLRDTPAARRAMQRASFRYSARRLKEAMEDPMSPPYVVAACEICMGILNDSAEALASMRNMLPEHEVVMTEGESVPPAENEFEDDEATRINIQPYRDDEFEDMTVVQDDLPLPHR